MCTCVCYSYTLFSRWQIEESSTVLCFEYRDSSLTSSTTWEGLPVKHAECSCCLNIDISGWNCLISCCSTKLKYFNPITVFLAALYLVCSVRSGGLKPTVQKVKQMLQFGGIDLFYRSFKMILWSVCTLSYAAIFKKKEECNFIQAFSLIICYLFFSLFL